METLARAANRGSIATDTGYTIDNSFVMEYNSTRTVEKTFGGFGGNPPTTTKGTISFWFKWASSTSTQGVAAWKLWNVYNSQVSIMPPGGTYDSSIYVALYNEGVLKLVSNAKFRDTSAWYHMVASFDTTQSTASDRVKIYINGVRITDWSTANYPSQNADLLLVKENTKHILGHDVNAGKPYGYYADMYYIHNQAKDVTDFGEFDADTGIWKPIEYTGTFGTYGYYWDFSNTSNYAEDQSGNNNDGQSFNTTAAMQATDTPTNNFATLNPLFKYPPSQVISEGGTEVTRTSGAGLNKTFLVTIPVNNGKWYAEFTPVSSSSNYVVGIMPDTTAATVTLDSNHLGNGSYPESIGYYSATGGCLAAGNAANGAYGDTYTAGNIIGIALDMDNGYVYFSKNSTWQNSGDPTSGSSGTGGIALTNSTAAHLLGFTYDSNGNMHCNFGGYTVATISSAASDANGYGTFEYAPPTGYYALCTKNLAQYG